jgi:hypothetical protein
VRGIVDEGTAGDAGGGRAMEGGPR